MFSRSNLKNEMNTSPVSKPRQRSPLRKALGRRYFILKRIKDWYFSGTEFARERRSTPLSETIKEHRSVLLRKLKAVDMQFQHNKIDNLRLAIGKINGIVIKPGETFSFWYLVGAPTKSKGYKPGLVLENGKIGSGTGGGLCQMGNLLYWMTLHSPLKVVERWRHSYDVFPDVNRTLPFGSGATLAYNYIDLQVKNETQAEFQFNLWLSDTHLEGALHSSQPLPHRYEVLETDHVIRGEFWGGYTRHNRIGRRLYDKADGELIREELVTENHAIMMYNPLLEGGKAEEVKPAGEPDHQGA